MDKLTMETEVIRVELAEDRAQVIRIGKATAPKGRCTAEIENISPLVVDKTVQCRVVSGAAEAASCRVMRRAKIERAEKPDDIASLQRAIEEKTCVEAALLAEIESAEAELAAEDDAFAFTLEELIADVSWGRGDELTWGKKLDAVESAVSGTLGRIFHPAEAKTALSDEIRDLKQKLATLQSPDVEVGASLLIDLVIGDEAHASGEPVELEISYVVPGACWRPCYTAELNDEMDRVRFSCDGMVWQNTGEDWSDVEVLFSTERVSLGASPPLLESDVIEMQKSENTVQVEMREETVFQCGLGQTKTVSELPGIDDGGEVLTLKGRMRVVILSDGRPMKVPIFSFESEAVLELRLLAELCESVILVSEQPNRSPYPILPGPVDLIRNRGFVGRTEINYIAPNERFELSFGPDDAVQVVREKETLNPKDRILSNWIETPYRMHLYLCNLSGEPRRIQVQERILVSDIEKIRVTVDTKETTNNALPDENGFIRWTADLNAHETKRIRLAYEIAKHPDVVGLDM